jgi:protein-S-isoprenylcysteine O-methyltransferase Ste14|tara:strand:+ start:1284 stop:1772 length:489 start_codon:yes stop_codon:yes gene_type:complete
LDFRTQYQRIFGVGPSGIVVTTFIWFLFYLIEKTLHINTIQIHQLARTILLFVFFLDAIYLVFGSIFFMPLKKRGRSVVKNGPYKFIRHPLYSALIYSGTGILALLVYSWGLLISVIPLTIFWSLHVRREEKHMLKSFGGEYSQYMKKTGQFIPKFKAIIDS